MMYAKVHGYTATYNYAYFGTYNDSVYWYL